jgi:bacterioferritin-associated ferredoxin
MSDEKKKTVVCRCEDITLEDVKKVINESYMELGDLKRLLRSGMGACQGRTCTRLIAQIVSHETGRPISEMRFPRTRPPIRPVPLGVLCMRILAENTSKTKNKEYKKQ